jgi:hypothetical protein
MNRGKLSTKVILLAGGIGLSVAAFGGSQSAAAQAYSDESNCPAGTVYYPTYGCTVSGDAYQPYDYGHYGSLPYDASGPYYGGHRGFGHGMGGGFNHGVGFAHGGGGGFGHGEGGGHR